MSETKCPKCGAKKNGTNALPPHYYACGSRDIAVNAVCTGELFQSIECSDNETSAIIAALVAELRYQRQGWINAIEVGVITGEYVKDAQAMAESASLTMTKGGEI